MGILIKLGMLFIAVMVAIQLMIALVPTALVLTVIAGIAVAIANGALCGFRDGNGEAAWQGACRGFGGTVNFGVGIVKMIGRIAFQFIKGLA